MIGFFWGLVFFVVCGSKVDRIEFGGRAVLLRI